MLGAFLLYILPYMLFFYFRSFNLAFRDVSLSTIYSFLLLTAVISFSYNIHVEKTGDYLFLIFSKPMSRTTYILGKLLGFVIVLIILWIFLTLLFFLSLWKIEGKEIFERTFRQLLAQQRPVVINTFNILWEYIKVSYIPLMKISVFILLFNVVFTSFMMLWMFHLRFITNIVLGVIMIFLINITFSLPSDTLKSILGLILPDISFFDFFYFNKFIFKNFEKYGLRINDPFDFQYISLVLLKSILYCSFYVIISGYILNKTEIRSSD